MYLVRVFYQPDPQSSCKLQEEKSFNNLIDAQEYKKQWHPCAYVVHIYERKEGWFRI